MTNEKDKELKEQFNFSYAQHKSNLNNVLLEAAKNGDVPYFIDDLLTPKEIESISQRLVILRLLSKGYPQRKVAEILGISVTTVNRGSRVKKYGTGYADSIGKE